MPKLVIPSAFCWTKMGAEAGEELETIVRRKEWERQLGDGVFVWGIGQSLGDNAQKAAEQLGDLEVFFSPMLSRAKSIDSEPDTTVVWNCWIDNGGRSHPLPQHVLVTSRATLPSGRPKLTHYALVCTSGNSLLQPLAANIQYSTLRNLVSDKPLGDSQVTAVVKVDNVDVSETGRIYPIAFSAKLERPYFVRLSQPRVLQKWETEAISQISAQDNLMAWATLVQKIRGEESYSSQVAPDLFSSQSWAGALAT